MGRGFSSSGGGRGFSSSSGRGHSSISGHGGGNRNNFFFFPMGTGTTTGGGRRYLTIGGLIGICILLAIFSLSAFFAGTSCLKVEYGTTTGTAIDNTFDGVYYYTTYTYSVDGVNYEETSSVGWEKKEVIGKQVPVYYLLEDASKMCDEERQTEKSVGGAIIAFILSAACVGGIVSTIISYKNGLKQQAEEKEKEKLNKPIDPITAAEEAKYSVCPYCGTKYLKTSSKCPSCGSATTK